MTECFIKWLTERKSLGDYMADPSDPVMKRFADREHGQRLWKKEKEGREYRDTPTVFDFFMAQSLMSRFAELELIRLTRLKQFMDQWNIAEIFPTGL